MKTTSIILYLCVISIHAVFAGDKNKHEIHLQGLQKQDEYAKMREMSSLQRPKAQAKTTGLSARLISTARRKHDGSNLIIQDSTFNIYSLNRGGDALSEYLKFDNGRLWTYNVNMYADKSRTNQIFDLNNNMLSAVEERFNTSLNTWSNYSKGIFSYDANSNVLVGEYQVWITATMTWRGSMKYIYTYDASNHMLSEVYQNWDNVNSNYINYTKYNYTYDGSGKMTEYNYQNWDANTSQWKNQRQELYSYDANNRLSVVMTNNWNNNLNSWVNDEKYTHSYNTSSQLSSIRVEKFTNNTWSNDRKDDYGYDGAGNMTSDIYSQWNASWEYVFRDVYTYDGSDNKLTDTYQQYNSVSQAFDNQNKYLYTYNSHNKLASYTTQSWGINTWVFHNGDVQNTYYYEDYNSTSIHQSPLATTDFRLYPVPTKDLLSVAFSWEESQAFSVSIIDMSDRTLQS